MMRFALVKPLRGSDAAYAAVTVLIFHCTEGASQTRSVVTSGRAASPSAAQP
jgi:hypothetical protein